MVDISLPSGVSSAKAAEENANAVSAATRRDFVIFIEFRPIELACWVHFAIPEWVGGAAWNALWRWSE
jgi:hypothetical protein